MLNRRLTAAREESNCIETSQSTRGRNFGGPCAAACPRHPCSCPTRPLLVPSLTFVAATRSHRVPLPPHVHVLPHNARPARLLCLTNRRTQLRAAAAAAAASAATLSSAPPLSAPPTPSGGAARRIHES